MTQIGSGDEKIPLWRDERVLRVVFQAIVLLILFAIGSYLVGNLTRNLRQLGRTFDFNFLFTQAGFNIGESIVPYQTNDLYWWAMVVGFLNTMRLVLIGFVATTLLGVIAGVASFSENWLVRKISLVYVEIIRNTPLLLQLFFWYFAVFFGLTQGAKVGQLPGSVLVSKRGIVIPWPVNSAIAWLSLGVLIGGAIVALFLWRWRIKLMEEQGASGKPQLMGLVAIGIISLLVFTLGLGWEFPTVDADGVNTQGGLRMSLEYASMLVGLSVYTGAFIAEIVRSGIQSVSKGQWEAARALGLHTGLSMRLVVLPQALRVIIPPLNSQYMNLAKNSSLAVAIGYPDVFATALTTQNQTGRAVEIILIIMLTYLAVDLIISLTMNWLNQAVQLKER
jgi:general L-amino acid transport system permease protein